MVKLAGYEERRPAQLSGGQRQRVALARALVNGPKVLLLDEPLGALDLKLREQMQEELKALQKALGITFVFVTHDQGEALVDGRPRGDLQRGQNRAGRHAGAKSTSGRIRASSPISSARPTSCRRNLPQRTAARANWTSLGRRKSRVAPRQRLRACGHATRRGHRRRGQLSGRRHARHRLRRIRLTLDARHVPPARAVRGKANASPSSGRSRP